MGSVSGLLVTYSLYLDGVLPENCTTLSWLEATGSTILIFLAFFVALSLKSRRVSEAFQVT